jgi:hypothetical protein
MGALAQLLDLAGVMGMTGLMVLLLVFNGSSIAPGALAGYQASCVVGVGLPLHR